MPCPTPEEINIHDSLDERVALESFQGKSQREAIALFHENAMLCAEALVHMGPRARLYYLDAYLQYLASDASRGNEWASSSLPPVAQAVIESGLASAQTQEKLLVALERVHSQFASYVPDRMTQRIYHQVPGEVRRVIALLRPGVQT